MNWSDQNGNFSDTTQQISTSYTTIAFRPLAKVSTTYRCRFFKFNFKNIYVYKCKSNVTMHTYKKETNEKKLV